MRKWITPLLSALAAAITSVIVYSDLPDRMIMHFNSSGSADNWIDKPFGAFLLPALALLIPCTVFLAVKLEKNDNKRRRAEAVNGSIAGMLSVMLLAIHSFLIAFNLGHEIHVSSFVTILVGILFILIGNVIPRVPQGSMQWPKLPEDKQRKASRFHGRFMSASGIIFLLFAFLQADWIMPAFFILLSVFLLITIGSMFYYTRSRAS